ncbi:MAG: J domain-containing protein [Pedobacter sp.]
MTYADLKASLAIFGFDERDQLTMAQIKRRHRELVKASHPDVANDAIARNMQRINAASSILFAYLHSYRFTFSEEEFYRQNPDERLRMQFANVPGWGS